MRILLCHSFCVALMLILASSLCLQAQEPDWEQQRQKMVQEQLKGRDIVDPKVLKAIQKVPRHRFVPDFYQDLAYKDRALPIAQGQTISQPYIVALMTQLADIDPEDRVLEIGTGSGYQAAVLAELSQEVYTIEIVPKLAKQAKETLQGLDFEQVRVKQGDGFQGWPEHAPFDAILVTCAPPEIPAPLLEQLAPEGRLVIPVGERWQELKVVHKTRDGDLREQIVTSVRFVPMTGHGVKELHNKNQP